MALPRVRAAYWEEHREVRRLSRYHKELCKHTWSFQSVNDLQGYYERGEIGVTEDLSGFVCVRHLKQASRPYTSIYYLGVRPDRRRSGIGAALLDWVLAASPHNALRAVVDPANQGGLAFYRAVGFRRISEKQTKRQELRYILELRACERT